MTPILKFTDYQVQAARTSGCNGEKYTPNVFDPDPPPMSKLLQTRLETVSLGVIGELGEFADYWKKVIGHGHPRDKDKEIKELGDQFWYGAELYSVFGLKMFNNEESDDLAKAQESFNKQIADYRAKYVEKMKECPDEVQPSSEFFDVASTIRQGSMIAALVAGTVDRILGYQPIDVGRMIHYMDSHVSLMCTVATLTGHDLKTILETNIAKLEARYPNGFNPESSINRKPE